jgi:tetratricopeptide (TPR) repeat protein
LKKLDQEERAFFLSSLDNYLARGLDQMALSQTIERLNRFPFDAELKMAYCNILMKTGREDEASELIGELENTLLNLSRIYAHLGDIHREKGMHREAVKFYRKFLALNPGSDMADNIHEKVNTLLAGLKINHEEVEEDEGQDTEPIAPHFRTLTMADLYIRQGHLDTAADILKEILKNDPDNELAAERLREMTRGLNNGLVDDRSRRAARIISELEKWMKKLGRAKTYGT